MYLCKVHFTKTDAYETNMSDKILHKGHVEYIGKNSLRVRIIQTSACSTCKAAQRCNALENKEKTIDIYHIKDTTSYHIGEEVLVLTSSQTGMNAVIISFGIPFFLMIGSVFVCSMFTKEEPIMALVGLCSLIPYYLIIYLMRNKLAQQFTFTVEKTS